LDAPGHLGKDTPAWERFRFFAVSLPSRSVSDTPAASVVFATHNRAARLEALLAALRAQTLGAARFEVVVVDDGSRDRTPDVLAAEEARGELDLTVIRHETARGPAAARNAGWRVARAPFVAFTDDDCRVVPEWLAEGMRAWGHDPGRFVQGRTDPDPNEIAQESPTTRTLRVRSLGPYFQTCNVFYPRELLERVGGFDDVTFTATGEDANLAWRCIESGAQAVFAPEAQAYHAVQDLGFVGKLKVAWRWHETIGLFARHAGMREILTYGVFWKKSHYILLRAGLGLLLPQRLRFLRYWFVWPVYDSYYARTRINGRRYLWAGPYFVLHDLVEMLAAVRGAIRYRTPVL
jgi:glycosyltransferase involved in cell wall biosynthesis